MPYILVYKSMDKKISNSKNKFLKTKFAFCPFQYEMNFNLKDFLHMFRVWFLCLRA